MPEDDALVGLGVRVPPALKSHLNAAAKREGVKPSLFVRRILERHLEHEDGDDVATQLEEIRSQLDALEDRLTTHATGFRRAVAAILALAGDPAKKMTSEQVEAFVRKHLHPGDGAGE